MEVVNYTNLKNNLKTYLDNVSIDNKKVIITRDKNKEPIVMISLKEYNENFFDETEYLTKSKKNKARLEESIKNVNNNNLTEININEL